MVQRQEQNVNLFGEGGIPEPPAVAEGERQEEEETVGEAAGQEQRQRQDVVVNVRAPAERPEQRDENVAVQATVDIRPWLAGIILVLLTTLVVSGLALYNGAKESTLRESAKVFADNQIAMLDNQSSIAKGVESVDKKLSAVVTGVTDANASLSKIKDAVDEVSTNTSKLQEKLGSVEKRNRFLLRQMEQKLQKILDEPITVRVKVIKKGGAK